VKWVHFPLHPDTPQEGKSLEALFAGRGFNLAQKQAEMRARMQAEGLPYGNRSHTYNSRLAQELGAWADTQPGGDAIHDAIFRAYFVDGLNIGDAQVLVKLAKAVGLPEDKAREVLEKRVFREAVGRRLRRGGRPALRGAGAAGEAGARQGLACPSRCGTSPPPPWRAQGRAPAGPGCGWRRSRTAAGPRTGPAASSP